MDAAKKKNNFFLKTWRSIGGGLNKSHPGHQKLSLRASLAPNLTQKVASQSMLGQRDKGLWSRPSVWTTHCSSCCLKMLKWSMGTNSEGPFLIPCEVNLFYKVLADMERKEVEPISCVVCLGMGRVARSIQPVVCAGVTWARVGGSMGFWLCQGCLRWISFNQTTILQS